MNPVLGGKYTHFSIKLDNSLKYLDQCIHLDFCLHFYFKIYVPQLKAKQLSVIEIDIKYAACS